jgi:hypothetical protein
VTIAQFAEMKNLGRRVLDLEAAARGTLLGLMRLQHQRAHVREHHLYERPRLLWKIRGWRRKARADLTRSWVLLASIEEVRREWSEARSRLEAAAEREGQTALFALDHLDDARKIDDLDTVPIQRGIENAARQMDSNALVLATGSTGFAGLVGVVIGHFL